MKIKRNGKTVFKVAEPAGCLVVVIAAIILLEVIAKLFNKLIDLI